MLKNIKNLKKILTNWLAISMESLVHRHGKLIALSQKISSHGTNIFLFEVSDSLHLRICKSGILLI